jgi:hypothetical protein
MRWPAKLVEKLTHIASELQDGDFPPTAQQIAVGQELAAQIANLRSKLNEIMTKDVAGFNTVLKQRGIQVLQ